jgi:gluconate 5-dehydrogenase
MTVQKLFDLTGRAALITGGSRGLGLQIAEALGELGARVALTARKANELEEAAAHLEKLGVEARTFPADLSDPKQVDPLVGR